MLRQPRTVWSVAFACVISFMGIGLVDPILKPIADELGAGPSEVSLLFTSYMAVMGVAMLGTGWVSSRIGPKWTLAIGLLLIITGSAMAGLQDGVAGIVAFRALWGLGNALFIATALATIVNAATGSVAEAIILYEAALGVGIAAGPLLGGWLGSMSWRLPFFGVAALMAIALIATLVTLPNEREERHPTPLSAPLRTLRDPGLLTVGVTALLYNFGFFTLLAFTPFALEMGALQIGLIFFGWGALLALSSVFVAPWVQRRVGTFTGIVVALSGFAVVLVVMGVFATSPGVLAAGVVIAGAFLGVNNTLITEAVMKVSDAERGTASAAYSFVRFTGGAVAPWLAGLLGEYALDLPFWVGAVAVLAAVGVLFLARQRLQVLDDEPDHGVEPVGSLTEARAVTIGDA
ncbi:MFS transporter [Micropruina sonneratiae]|uniref:MFS transporter n=1 Tax=Micropruina sonneratiae TaxID=2986940 RepID=UPI002225BB7A|nr:MFS transporter [Micropruina sp. KQZ13P-5]MCW3158892.1 MFS transporter [Micropruina sp. KQZ13P-5]